MHETWNSEAEALELERQEYMKKVGIIEYWKVPLGETVIEVMSEYPPEDNSKNKDKKDIRVLVDGEEKKWSVNRKSPMYRVLINSIKAGKKIFKLIRVGEDTNTRYHLIPM